MKALVLLNRGGGRVASEGPGLVDELRAALARHGVESQVRVVDGGELAALARDGRDGHDAVVVGGGDGSVASVAAVLAGQRVPLGVLPFGTLNHFARDLGIPSELDAAVATIAAGRTRAVDVAEVNGRVFVTTARSASTRAS